MSWIFVTKSGKPVKESCVLSLLRFGWIWSWHLITVTWKDNQHSKLRSVNLIYVNGNLTLFITTKYHNLKSVYSSWDRRYNVSSEAQEKSLVLVWYRTRDLRVDLHTELSILIDKNVQHISKWFQLNCPVRYLACSLSLVISFLVEFQIILLR